MESTGDRSIFKRSKNDQEDFMEIQDSSLVYKLRRSCERIEQLMKDTESLRRENDLKSKIILNMQGKQRQLLATIQSLRDIIDSQDVEFKGFHQKLLLTEIDCNKKDEIQTELTKLKNRYANCQEENIILRHQIKENQREIYLYHEALKIRNTQFKQKQDQISQLKKQKDTLMKEIIIFEHMKQEIDLMRGINIQKDNEMELQLAKYRQILSNYSLHLHDAIKNQEQWHNYYASLSDTVEHIEDLRQAYRIRKALK